MDARQPIHSDSVPARLLPAALVLLAAALALMAVPAAVAVISMLDGHVLDRTQEWLSSSLALATPYFDLARLGVTLVLAAAVRTAKADQ
jgi:putative effector of murein hydrolase LrgA (UPF0299 family)